MTAALAWQIAASLGTLVSIIHDLRKWRTEGA